MQNEATVRDRGARHSDSCNAGNVVQRHATPCNRFDDLEKRTHGANPRAARAARNTPRLPCYSPPLPVASSAPKIHAIDAFRRDEIQEYLTSLK